MHRRLFTLAPLAAGLLLAGCERSVLMAESDGAVALKAKDYAKARDDYAYAVDKNPGGLGARMGLGQALIGLDQPQAARTHLETAYTLAPNNDEVVDALAESMLRSGEVDQMLRLLRLRAEEKGRPSDYIRLGKFANRAKDADTAKAALLSAAKIDKGANIEPQLALADFYESVGDKPQALRRLGMALFLKPRDAVIQQRIRALGGVPGPTAEVMPLEASAAER